MVKVIFLVMVGLAAINCSDSSTNYIEAELNKEFEIKVGNSAILSDQGLIIKFKSVADDSRCPIDAICVWEGNAATIIEMRNSFGGQLTTKLNTTLGPISIDFSGVIITLVGLNPYPKSTEPINPNDYVIKLIVKNR